MFHPEELLDLKQFAYLDLFANCEHVWDALKKLPAFVKNHVKPSQPASYRYAVHRRRRANRRGDRDRAWRGHQRTGDHRQELRDPLGAYIRVM